MKAVKVLLHYLFIISICSCMTEEVLVHGDISGIVTDEQTSEPIDSVSIGLDPSKNNSIDILSGSDGSFLLKSIQAGSYEITASKPRYETVSRDIVVESGKTIQNDFELSLVPWPEISVSFLDFGRSSTSGSFTIKNVGSGLLNYTCQSALDWIEIAEKSGDVSTETDTIHVSIDRSAISEEIQKEFIKVISFSNEIEIRDTVNIYLNGLADEEGNYYGIVKIGTQTWMSENLNTGKMINKGFGSPEPSNNNEIEKYCYENAENNCEVYGGLYTWVEMMDYPPIDIAPYEYNIQGICPAGWHIPNRTDWETLIEYLEPMSLAGSKLKDTTSLWKSPNLATNESGFSALPGGAYCRLQAITDDPADQDEPDDFYGKGEAAFFWHAYLHISGTQGEYGLLEWDQVTVNWQNQNIYEHALSVRCVKDP